MHDDASNCFCFIMNAIFKFSALIIAISGNSGEAIVWSEVVEQGVQWGKFINFNAF